MIHPYQLDIARACDLAGFQEKAIDAYRSVLDVCRSLYGDFHTCTLESLHAVAVLERKMTADPSKAIECYEECLACHREALGSSHEETLSLIDSLAALYASSGSNEKALVVSLSSLLRTSTPY